MSVEDSHGYASRESFNMTGRTLARLRQTLYDAKLALSSGSVDEAKRLLNIALDETQALT